MHAKKLSPKPQTSKTSISYLTERERIKTQMSATTVAATSRKIGFLGLGMMGQGMASVLLNSFKAKSNNGGEQDALTVWNRTISKADALKANGAFVANSPQEMAKSGCSIVYAMLADPKASVSVAEQFAEGLRENKGMRF
jgi:3-hydroxyisobutyrate dehydrogenase-like beta-hydroxyacid dehydrogenase